MMEGPYKRIDRTRVKGEDFRDLFDDISKLPIDKIIAELKRMPSETRQAISRKLPKKTLGKVLSEWYKKK